MSHFKGKCSIEEVERMPMRLFHGLYSRIMIKMSTEEGQNAIAGEEFEDQMKGDA